MAGYNTKGRPPRPSAVSISDDGQVNILLTQGKCAIVDECDAHLSAWKWCATYDPSMRQFKPTKTFNLGNGKFKGVSIYHAIVGQPLNRKMVVDHINGNPLDNRRSNLRIVSARDNSCNGRRRREGLTKSKFPGVHWSKTKQKWVAIIGVRGKNLTLGTFDSEEKAAALYQSVRHCSTIEEIRAIVPARHDRKFCGFGHEFTPENTMPNGPGRRRCRMCFDRQWRAAYARRKGHYIVSADEIENEEEKAQ